jgi:imidazoleglycerol-phosphate dehydratase
MSRSGKAERETRETRIRSEVLLEGKGDSKIESSIGFLDHMLATFARHGRFDISLSASGDLEVDQHHLVEDCGLVLGETFSRALGDRRGINRAGFFVFPMDEALAVVAADLGGRPYLQYQADFARRFCGGLDTDLLPDFFQAFAVHLRANLVVRMPYGRSDHHRVESVFKAFGRAMRMACSLDVREIRDIPSAKGVIDHDRDR